MKTYSELISIPSYDERLKYLRTNQNVQDLTFGTERYLNQQFYRSAQWRSFRNDIIIRDDGCDLAIPGLAILDNVYIHHINPITIDDINNCSEILLNPENVICCSMKTHNLIHFGKDYFKEETQFVERKPNDTCPWK